jgi:colanic acid/amylovoran biosynthesis glycosyltransferase
MLNVLHFVRKNTQLKASFINNQISHHINFKPAIIIREHRSGPYDGGFANFNMSEYPTLDLSCGESTFEKIRYKTLKTISERQINQILAFIKKHNINICHFHYGSDCGVYEPLLKRLPVPSVVSFYGYDCSSFPKRFFGYGKFYLKNRVFKHISKVLAMSPDMKNDLIASGCPTDKIKVHYYGTDVDLFYNPKKQLVEHDHITILNLCSLVPQKGQLFLLAAVADLVSKGIKNFTLRIVGTGNLETELKVFVKNHGLSEYVKFIGAIKYGGSEMIKEYHDADIFIHPSVVATNGDKEGIPGTIVEAMSAGIPVIATYHAGIPYIIEHNVTGWLVKENDVESLSEALVALIKKPLLRESLGLAGQRSAIENLNLLKKEAELENIYASIINNT